MTTFDDLRGYLPSLYRPEDDDATGEALPLRATDILAINGAPPAANTLSESGFNVVVTLPAAQAIQTVRLQPGAAAGSTLFLEFYRFGNGLPLSRPAVVAAISEGLATLPPGFSSSRFAIRLRRPGLLSRFLKVSADSIDAADRTATDVLQAHWFRYADSALYHPYAVAFRQRTEPPQPTPHPRDPALAEFPYVHDLARLAALLAIPPWQQPPPLRELVEAYRLRIARMIAIYRSGLGTLDALRAMIEAHLPPTLTAADEDESPQERALRLEQQDRPFWLEEYAPLVPRALKVTMPGPPADMVGPLMRWTVNNDGLTPAAPTIYVQGVAPVPDKIDATQNPIIELYSHGGHFPRLGILFRGKLKPDQVLRLRPASSSWLGMAGGVLRSESLPVDDAPPDPTAPGPWVTVPDSPEESVVAMAQTEDLSLWVATEDGGAGKLWRHNGREWHEAVTGLAPIHCLLEDEQTLLIGTDGGLRQMPLYPTSGTFATSAAGFNGTAVFALHRAANGDLWVGTEAGAQLVGGSATPLQNVEVYAIAHDADGTLYFGTALGLFLYQPGLDDWYWYAGEESSDRALDWQPFEPGVLPEDTQVFLPPVRAIFPGGDTSLWLGTDFGVARYVARSTGEGALTYTTLLEAFPDLSAGRVFQIQADERGLVWFATDRGLFRYDGRDLWQFTDGAWQQKGRADSLYGEDRLAPDPRGAWRYHRTLGQWQRFNASARTWLGFAEPLRAAEEPAVQVFLWTDGVTADLGTWDDAAFTQTGTLAASAISMRFKPAENRIVDGGVPAVPRLPAGSSTWRYLTLEQRPRRPKTLPAWTIEGRLIPPPPNRAPAPPGRYDQPTPPPPSVYDNAVYAFNPTARVWLTWQSSRLLTVLARLKLRTPDDALDPAILDRARQGIGQVRPAAVRVMLAVEEEILE